MTAQQYGDYQFEIDFDGLEGRVPKRPVDFPSLERKAGDVLPRWLYSYVAGGGGDEATQRANVSAFSHYRIDPRMTNGAHEPDLSVSLFGMTLPTPLFMAPVGVIGVCSQDRHGDIQVAKASAATGVPWVASTLSQDRLEDVAPHAGDTPGLFQLDAPSDRELAESFVCRAERAGYRAIVVTLDTGTTGRRPKDLNTDNFAQSRSYNPSAAVTHFALDRLSALLWNYFTDEVFLNRLKASPQDDLTAATREWIKTRGNPLQWAELTWLRSVTRLPILVKGICLPDDVRRAKDYGADGIYCSNHGGRQANGGLPALDALPAVLEAADGMPVLFDSGVRTGSDIAIALAMGATAVGVGRPYIYALAVGGTDGVVSELLSLLAELDLLMAIYGFPTVADLRAAGIQRE